MKNVQEHERLVYVIVTVPDKRVIYQRMAVAGFLRLWNATGYQRMIRTDKTVLTCAQDLVKRLLNANVPESAFSHLISHSIPNSRKILEIVHCSLLSGIPIKALKGIVELKFSSMEDLFQDVTKSPHLYSEYLTEVANVLSWIPGGKL